MKDRRAWCAAVHGVEESQKWLSDQTTKPKQQQFILSGQSVLSLFPWFFPPCLGDISIMVTFIYAFQDSHTYSLRFILCSESAYPVFRLYFALVSWLHICLPNQVELQWISSHGISHMTYNSILFIFKFPQEWGKCTHKTWIQPVSWDWRLLFCPLPTAVRLLVTSSKNPASVWLQLYNHVLFVLGKIFLCFGDPFILFSYLICYYYEYGEESVTTL